MLDIITQIKAKTKALAIIHSCIDNNHYKVAEKYIELYYRKFDDFLGYNGLKRELQRIRVESLSSSR